MTGTGSVQPLSCVCEADWRFLLPGGVFDHLVLAGGPPELPDALVNLGVARRVSRQVVAGSADAVILLAGADESIQTAASAVAPGGVLYWEIDRRERRHWMESPHRARRRLRRLGLTPATSYWVKPGFGTRQMYVPLGGVAPFRWYLDTLYRSRTPARQVVNTVLRTLAVHHQGLTTFAPCIAVTAVNGPLRRIGLLETARAAGVGIRADSVPVLLGQGSSQWNRTVLALFDPDAVAPTAIVKVPRTTAFNPQIEWEHQTLQDLQRRLGPALRGSVPTSSLFRWKDLAVSVEAYMPGASIYSRSGPSASGSREDLRLTAAWLSAFHRETTLERVPAREWLREHLIDGLCAEYAATFGLTAAEADLFAAVKGAIEMLGVARLPLVWQHADFCPPNVYLDGERISVIDWETARHGPALADLLVFVTYWSAMVDGEESDAGCLDHFQRLFFGTPTALSKAVYREIATYALRVGVPLSLLPFLLVYTFVEKALARPRRLAQMDVARRIDRDANLEVGYVGLLGRHAGRLFEGEVFRAA